MEPVPEVALREFARAARIDGQNCAAGHADRARGRHRSRLGELQNACVGKGAASVRVRRVGDRPRAAAQLGER